MSTFVFTYRAPKHYTPGAAATMAAWTAARSGRC
jgi:hypothetical protein